MWFDIQQFKTLFDVFLCLISFSYVFTMLSFGGKASLDFFAICMLQRDYLKWEEQIFISYFTPFFWPTGKETGLTDYK